MNNNTGILYIIPTNLGCSDINKISPPFNIKIINTLNEFIVEKIRTARRYFKSIGYTKSLDNIIFHTINKYTVHNELTGFLNSAINGKNIGLLSEAGCPCIADPGADIVKIAQQKNIKVIPLTGPNSILLGLMASGFNGQNFAFSGYLPINKEERTKKIKQIEKKIYNNNQTQIFIETPYRNVSLFEDILKTCENKTLLCIATNITLKDESIITKPICEWKKSLPDIHKKATVFLLYK
jgi:16S rRNA (cytidine1402-2'-O)-methyltransferase